MATVIYREPFPDNIELWGTLCDVNLGAIQNVIDGGQGKAIKYQLIDPVEGATNQNMIFSVNHIEYNQSVVGGRVNNHPFDLVCRFPNISTDDIKEGAFYVRQNTKYNAIVIQQDWGDIGIYTSWNWNQDRFPFGFMYLDSNDVIRTASIDTVIRDGVNVSWHYWYGDYTERTGFDQLFTYLDIKNSQVILKVPYKMFKSEEGARKFLKYGDDSEDLDKGGDDEEVAEDRTSILYFYDTVTRSTFGVNDAADYFKHSIEFKIKLKDNLGELITDPRRTIVGYVKSSIEQSTFSNIEWLVNEKTKILSARWSYGEVGGTEHQGTTPPDTTPDIMGFYDQERIDNKIYKSRFFTNMLIFANKSDAERYLEGDTDVRPIYNGHDGQFNPQGDIGDRYIYNTQSYDISNEMSSVWILNKAQLDDLASVLATGLTKAETSDDLLVNITRSTARSFTALAEPVDMVCDLFWLPVSVTEFCNSHEDNMQFGEDTYGIAGTLDTIVDAATGRNYKVNSTVERWGSKLNDTMADQMSRMLTEGLDVRVDEEPQPPSNN